MPTKGPGASTQERQAAKRGLQTWTLLHLVRCAWAHQENTHSKRTDVGQTMCEVASCAQTGLSADKTPSKDLSQHGASVEIHKDINSSRRCRWISSKNIPDGCGNVSRQHVRLPRHARQVGAAAMQLALAHRFGFWAPEKRQEGMERGLQNSLSEAEAEAFKANFAGSELGLGLGQSTFHFFFGAVGSRACSTVGCSRLSSLVGTSQSMDHLRLRCCRLLSSLVSKPRMHASSLPCNTSSLATVQASVIPPTRLKTHFGSGKRNRSRPNSESWHDAFDGRRKNSSDFQPFTITRADVATEVDRPAFQKSAVQPATSSDL
ncbi:unnamed protein product [Symbiodinium sp. KB8]|nr:unnamed protein product [Symbiodinium sp. KB8]